MDDRVIFMQIDYEFDRFDWFLKIIIELLQEYVGKRHQEFAGNGQHDAQELLTILLDALHEVNPIFFCIIVIQRQINRILIVLLINH